MRVHPGVLRIGILLLALALLAPFVPAATAAPDRDEACDPAHPENARRVFIDPRSRLRVEEHVLCVREEGVEPAVVAAATNDCPSTAYVLASHKWTTPYSFLVDARGAPLDATTVLAAFSASGETWDAVAAADVHGSAKLGGAGASAGTRDKVNQAGFKSMGKTGVLGRTTTWFTSTGTALESDMVYNTDYGWSTTGAAGKADLASVATHELGHALGLSHAATTSANACLTMYPSTPLGSLQGRTLGVGDILGIQKKYGAATPVAEPFSATFAPEPGNERWVELDVFANRALAGVSASVNGSAPIALAKMSWGSWAASFYVPAGSVVRFSATSTDGAKVDSPSGYVWPTATPVASTFTATFTKHAANGGWIETQVFANLPVASVAASLNGGTPFPLDKTSWGTWAKAVAVPAGSTVVFVATATDGQKATSGAFPWP